MAAVDRSTPHMATALPELPMPETVMVRLLRISVVGLGHFFEPVFREIGLTESSFHVLCLLMASESGAVAPSELSELVGTSRANMTRIVDALVADGFATRSAEARDARRLVVRITAAGRRVAKHAVPKLVAPLNDAFSGLDANEFQQLQALLRKAIKSFDNSAVPLRSAA